MSTLSVNNIRFLVSCDKEDNVYENVNLYCENGLIKYIGSEKHDADTVIDGSGMLCYPGLVNAHHHLYQVFSRNLEKPQFRHGVPFIADSNGRTDEERLHDRFRPSLRVPEGSR